MSKTIPYPHELSTEEAHALAATALANKLKWSGTFFQGGLKDGYVFVNLDTEKRVDGRHVVLGAPAFEGK